MWIYYFLLFLLNTQVTKEIQAWLRQNKSDPPESSKNRNKNKNKNFLNIHDSM